MASRSDRLWYAAALVLGIVPLWMTRHLPIVDLPQHLHLISVLHRLGDVTTLYPQTFTLRGELTPYLGYYYLVSLLNWLLPLELANKVFLSAYVVAFPLSVAFLLRALGRPAWPSVLALPFAYGDSFAWGFVNFVAALPVAIASCALFVLAICEPARRRVWAGLLAFAAVAVLLFHVQAYAFLAAALPFLLLTTAAPEDRRATGERAAFAKMLGARGWALAAVVPSVALFLVWVVARIGQPTEIEPGVPWKAWGPMLSPQNLAYKTFDQNRSELLAVLANELRDGTDRWPLYAIAAVAAAGLFIGAMEYLRDDPKVRWIPALRLPGLAALALVLFFTLPFDIRGFSYYLNTRYAHLAAPLAIAAIPPVASLIWRRRLLLAGVACAALLAVTLGRGYAQFGQEASALDALVPYTPPKPRVMGLIFDPGSRVVTHPVYLHAAAFLARERGGLANFSFALTPHSPIKYQGAPPPTFPSEWRPDQFHYDVQGRAYDTFVLRGVTPSQVFGPLLESELAVATRADGFWLVRRR